MSIKQNSIHDEPTSGIPGWDNEWEFQFSPFQGSYVPGRICAAHKTRYDVILPGDMLMLPISGAMKAKRLFPVVGDFVVVLNHPDQASRMIVSILKRRTALSRGGAGETAGEQMLAANIDIAFVVTDPGSDFSISRLERYLLIVHASGATPIIIVNKSDTSPDVAGIIDQVRQSLGDVYVFALSAMTREGLDQIEPYLNNRQTVVVLGSSGVGKSTLINALIGSNLQKTGHIREDDGKGRHTTTVRHLILLPSGCSLIDTPGLREIRVWTAAENMSDVFGDIMEVASRCRFSNCTHEQEPGCAVQAEISAGKLSPDHLDHYRKILKEVSFERDKAEIGLKRLEKKKFQGIRILAKEYREQQKYKVGR
ncbi:MAG TPA: ribosome small subunit-dependent GTPase A [Methanospirillum sp.]|nr:ribosome small subunit-dependent GTPase A [Methanospirillum sp.]